MAEGDTSSSSCVTTLENMTVLEFAAWLREKKFSVEVQEAFEDQEMDGEAVQEAFACCSGLDCLKAVLPKYGQRLKVYNCIKSAFSEEYKEKDMFIPSPPGQVFDSDGLYLSLLPHSAVQYMTKDADCSSGYPASPTSTMAPSTKPPSVASSSVTVSFKHSTPEALPNKVPDPFPIPKFRPYTQENLSSKRLADDDRKYIVRQLATMLLSKVQKPSMKDCTVVAKSLFQKHPFLKEHHSWSHFIYICCQNCNRKPPGVRANESPQPKRAKIDPYKHSYPSLDVATEDDVSFTRNLQLLKSELEKAKSSTAVVTSLMTRTFTLRRQSILDEGNPVNEICTEYPFLRRAIYVADLVLKRENTRDTFEHSWEKYSNAIIKYAEANSSKPKELRNALRGSDYEDDDVAITAMRCLAYFLIPKHRGQTVQDAPFLITEVLRGTPPSESVDKGNNCPHVVRITDPDTDIVPQHFIAIEQQLLIQCRSFSNAIYTLLAAYFIFNIEDHPKAVLVLEFLQEKMLEVSEAKSKKSALYSSFSAAVDCYLADI